MEIVHGSVALVSLLRRPTLHWLVALAPSLSFAAHAQYTPPNDAASPLKSAAQTLADSRDRQRRVVYTPYPASPERGIVRAFVHVSDGTAVLARTDLVVDAPMPIIVRRAYHSARTASDDFGATGWRLTLAERIERNSAGELDYIYGNGSILKLTPSGRLRSPLQAYLTDVEDVSVGRDAIQVRTRTGITKQFRRRDDAFLLASVRDEFGNRLELHYSQRGALRRIDSSSGVTLNVHRDRLGRIESLADSHGRVVRYGFDHANRLVTATDPAEQVWLYGYDAAGRLTSGATPNGILDTALEYDGGGRVLVSRVNGRAYTFSYQNAQTSVVNPEGLRTLFDAAPSGLTVGITNALGTRTALELSGDGVPLALVRNEQRIVQFSTFERGRRSSTAEVAGSAAGETYTIRYDKHDRVTDVASSTGRSGFSVEGYRAGLMPTALTHVDGTREEARLSASGELEQLTDRNGRSLTFRRDAARWRINDAKNRTIELRFNPLGQLAAAKAVDGQELAFAYNDVGLRERTELPKGARITYQYDGSGNLIASASGHADQPLLTYTYATDASNRVNSIVRPAGDRHEFTYDERGRLVQARQPDGAAATFEYDELSRLTAVQFADSSRAEHTYAPGDPDIAAQLSARLLPVFNQQKEINDFASRFDTQHSRVRPAVLGLFTYDELHDELTLAADPQLWTPLAYVNDSIAALRLDALLAYKQADIDSFIIPSNRLFVPAEFWAVNCCNCPCDWQNDYFCAQTIECQGCSAPPPPPPIPSVHVLYTMFIPLDHVRLPLSASFNPTGAFYAGDSKTVYTGGDYRIQQEFTINLTYRTVNSHAARTGLTHGYAPYQTHLTPGTCFRNNCTSCKYPLLSIFPGEDYVFLGQCRSGAATCTLGALDMETIEAHVIDSTDTSVTVEFSGDPDNACQGTVFGIPLAADISWVHHLTIDWSLPGPARYTLVLDHDGFPSHQIELNSLHVYGFDPVDAGSSPASLGPPRDIAATRTGSL